MPVDAPTATTVAPLLISAAHCAELCGISRASWFAWQSSGFAPAAVLRRGRLVRWSADEIQRWCESGCPPRDRWNVVRGARP
jgi:predicted DNA-binding transcriptional regulator AlpA